MSLSKTCCPLLGAGSIQEDCPDKAEMNFIENKITKKKKRKKDRAEENIIYVLLYI